MSQRIDLARGVTFGRWTVMSGEGPRYLCRCACGRERRVRSDNLRTGRSRSCHKCNHPRELTGVDIHHVMVAWGRGAIA